MSNNTVHYRKGVCSLVGWFMKRNRQNNNVLTLVYGETGSGKTYTAIRKAYELDSIEVDYGLVLATSYVATNNTEKWEALFEQLSTEFPFQPEVWLDWGVALHENGEINKALDITEQGLENSPRNPALLYRMGALCYLSGNQDVAILILERALELNAQEHFTLFIFAPELKKAIRVLECISRFTQPKFSDE